MTFSISDDYDTQVPALRRILDVSEKTRWSVNDIDWAHPLSPGAYGRILEWHGVHRSRYIQELPDSTREALARQLVAYDFSQTLHGEQAAMMVAAQLVNNVDDLDGRIYAANQARDEARHVEALSKLIKRIGPIYPIRDFFGDFVHKLLNFTLWPKQVLGLQLFLEARALQGFRQHLVFVEDPVFTEAIHNVERDESQHVAFGVQYIARGISEMNAAEREDIVAYAHWLDAGVWAGPTAEDYRCTFDEAGVDFDQFRATIEPPSRLRPSGGLGREVARTVQGFQTQFRSWFYSALNRAGLPEVAERRFGRPMTREEIDASVRGETVVLPWVEDEKAAREAEEEER